MSASRKVLVWLLLGIVFVPLPTLSQDAPKTFKPEELDQLAAPIALHPDPLVAQILMASTYPLEIVQAARFVKDNPKLKDDQLNQALQQHPWDDSVKSLVFFPQVLTMMNDKLDWLQKLGDAFLSQQQDLMAARPAAAGARPGRRPAQEHPGAASDRRAALRRPRRRPRHGAATTTVQVAQPQRPSSRSSRRTRRSSTCRATTRPSSMARARRRTRPTTVSGGLLRRRRVHVRRGTAVGAALWGDCNWNRGRRHHINNSVANNFTTASIASRRPATASSTQQGLGGAGRTTRPVGAQPRAPQGRAVP